MTFNFNIKKLFDDYQKEIDERQIKDAIENIIYQITEKSNFSDKEQFYILSEVNKSFESLKRRKMDNLSEKTNELKELLSKYE